MTATETPTPNMEHRKAQAAYSPAGTRMQTLRTITVIIAILTGLSTAAFSTFAIILGMWQFSIVAVVNGLALFSCFVSLGVLYPRGRTFAGTTITFLLFGAALLSMALFLANLGIATAVIFLVFTLILSSSVQDERLANLSTLGGLLIAVICATLPEMITLPQISSPYVSILTPAVLGILFMIYVTMLSMQFVSANMRTRLVTAFIAIVVVPLAILSVVQSRFAFELLREQTNESLHMAARQTASSLETFIRQTRDQFSNASQFSIFYRYLDLPAEQRAGSPEENELRATLRILGFSGTGNLLYVPSYALLDPTGLNVFDTASDQSLGLSSSTTSQDPNSHGKGSNEGNFEYFKVPYLTGSRYTSPMIIKSNEKAFLYFSSPVKNDRGLIVGVLRVRFDGLILQQFVRENNGLAGDKSYVMVLDENNIRLADGFTPLNLFKSLVPLTATKIQTLQAQGRLPDNFNAGRMSTNEVQLDQAVRNYFKDSYFSFDMEGGTDDARLPEVGVIYPMQGVPWKVIYLVEDYDDAVIRKEQQRTATILTTLIAGLVGMIAVFGSQILNRPITVLMKTAQRISSGDLDAEAPADGQDEFGMLGSAFNAMTSQVRGFINELEDRVRARTEEIESQNVVLAERAKQIQTVSEVARQIVSVQDLETLLASMTKLVSERFGFYHVGIFLLDENKEYAILRAANSEGGQRMLARNHMLPVGRVGIVGSVTGSGEAKIATDVGAEATFFNNPDLPLTRSEMALPLKFGEEIMGALDIQSTESIAFDEQDIELFTILADQIAIAIYNNRLYSETVLALNEAQSLHRNYLRSEWDQELAARKTRGFLYNRRGVSAQEMELPIWDSVISTGIPHIEAADSSAQGKSAGARNTASIAVPITVRGEHIGVIHVQDQGEERSWTEDELMVVNDVASQVAVALENARLFEATVRRAEREKKVLEITARIRSTNEPDRMMQIAIHELQKALGATRAQIYVRKQQAAVDAGDGFPTPADGHNGANGTNGSKVD